MVRIIIIKKISLQCHIDLKNKKDGKELKSLWMGKGKNNGGEKY